MGSELLLASPFYAKTACWMCGHFHLLGLVVFGYDVFAYEGFFAYNPIIFSAGYISIFSLMGVVLVHLEVIRSKGKSISKPTYKDLYKEHVPSAKILK